MRFSLYMAARYLWGGRNRYARFIAWVSLIGLALGVLVLTVVVSVMNGLGEELRSRILGTVPHALVTPAEPEILAMLDAHRDVRRAYRFFSASGMVASGGAVVPVSLFALDPGTGGLLSRMAANADDRALEKALAQPDAIVLGGPIARHLGLTVGDSVVLVVSDVAGGVVHPRLKRFRLAATFAIGAELDHALAITRRDSFTERERRALGTDGVRVELTDPLLVAAFVNELRDRKETLGIETWQDNYGELFRAVRIEKGLMFLILLLVVAVAGFNIVSGQTVLVNDKRGDIAILRTMGANTRLITGVFLWQGIIIATLGIALGVALGVLVAKNIGYLMGAVESWLGFSLLDGSYFDRLPSRVLVSDLLIIALLSWLLCVLAAWVPARRTAHQNPVAGLHV